MKRYWIEFRKQRPKSAMSFWTHKPVGTTGPWVYATTFDPPRQPAVPGKGYPVFFVDYRGFTFEFASLEEIEHCIATLERRVLPRTIDLSAQRGTTRGPNSHWLSRLPARVKSWKYRQGAVVFLRTARDGFAKMLTD